ncbi:hypothetical protein I4U23_016593 [Adineta vaga]|nr:hypothetical protein I4U23_016593 [Adineta vaga]
MDDATSVFNESTTRIQWMWNADTDPFSKSQPVEWKPYSDVENMIIEEAFQAGQDHVVLDNYSIDFKHNIQVLNEDGNKQRPIKRMSCRVDTNHVREERFTFTPINHRRPFGGLYGWISPFITEVAKYLKITIDQLPSKDIKVIPLIVEEAALGIVEEGKKIGKQREAAKIAKILREKKHAVMKEVWECCAHLYSLESFLYKKLNETMRLIGDQEYEQTWRDKVRTLGPFCLLLWDNPSNYQSTQNGTILYRGAALSDELISIFKEDYLIEDKPVRSFQSFTSCTRDRAVAEMFGNVLFIMTVKHAFAVDLKPFSKYPDEEEELVSPGVCFTINRVEYDQHENKHVIYLELVQQYRQIDRDQISSSYVRGEYNDTPYDPDDETTHHFTQPGDRNGERFNDWI